MFNFPNPTTGKCVIDGLIDTRQFDPTRRTPMAAGYQQLTVHATWVPKKWIRTLRGLTDAEAAAILTHEQDVNFGQDTFAWDNVQKSIVYLVAFDESVLPLKMTPDGRNDQWRCDVGFVQRTNVEITTGDWGFGTYGTGVYLPA